MDAVMLEYIELRLHLRAVRTIRAEKQQKTPKVVKQSGQVRVQGGWQKNKKKSDWQLLSFRVSSTKRTGRFVYNTVAIC